MPRYIDAHRAENLLIMCGTYHGVISFDTVIDVLHDTQTADVVERKRGKWVKKNDDVCYWYECSVCGEKPPLNIYRQEWHSWYCPSCGAEMRGEEDDN